ncbi:M20 family metallopeptidase [Paraburkholderia caffeinilytica]|uniref:M20 family metallopeptidase n=1 Tax=Paraburkholderia caffeinilytica TaxID=1761016 RepID=UPI003DA17148
MTRSKCIGNAASCFDSGRFLADLDRRVRMRTESQRPSGMPVLHEYLQAEILPRIEPLGFSGTVLANPVDGGGPLLLATRIEDPSLPTVLLYGHADVVRGQDDHWEPGISPWCVTVKGDRLYGRGTADNKGQHSINLAALKEVLHARAGKLGFNVKLLMESGEETGSPGLDQFCERYRDALASDLLIASDGPRARADRPCVFLGSRGLVNFTLSLQLREGAHHSGNWGGLLRNPGTVLANALSTLVDARGTILVDALRPQSIPEAVRNSLRDIAVGGGPGDPVVDADWGEIALTPSERVYGWNALEVLAFTTGDPAHPVGAIPSAARAHCQLRYVVGTQCDDIEAILRRHLDERGFNCVSVEVGDRMAATRLSPDDAWVNWALDSIQATTGKKVDLLPNLGGTIPNSAFADVLGLPTLWIPHSYGACCQHAPNEHLLGSVAREALQIMAGLFWDLGEDGADILARRP